MALDPYAACPCGSGKKFKWCCQPIYVDIDKAFRQDEEGQHEAALKVMDQVVAEHPANPEAWGRRAQILYQNDRVDDAEASLQKALDINPNYPFGHLLRGQFRQAEGGIAGAAREFRTAIELYDPEAKDLLGQVYALLADCELKLNKPVAARAALQQAARCQPANEELRKGLEALFGDKSPVPASGRKEYQFLSPSGSGGGRRTEWDQALAGLTSGKLSEAARAFERLTASDPGDAAAWYNLALCRAWLGENDGGLEALDRYVGLEADEVRAAAAWTLGEILRCGQGMEDDADYVEHSQMFQVREPQGLAQQLQGWQAARRLIGLRAEVEQGPVTGLVLEKLPPLAGALAATQAPKLGAYLLIFADRVRLWHTNPTALEAIAEELRQNLGPALAEPERMRGPVNFHDVLAEALVFPVWTANAEEAKKRVAEYIERYFEETWIHRPLRSLNLISPMDAAGHPILRKKLSGVIEFLDECRGGRPDAVPYDFARLRHKLGLSGEKPAAAGNGAGASAADLGAMSAAELAALPAHELTDDRLEEAYRAALKLDAREIAGKFARLLVARPPNPKKTDRYPWYSHLMRLALSEGDSEAALNYVNEGERSDCEQNEGRRRNDYELRRGQVLARRGDADEAERVFSGLIARVPAEARFRISAAEAMLSANQPDKALRFAEEGLTQARKANDRDSEEYFKELVGAAKRKVGAGT
jgi:tetratricopeptide (TPR) repeat protein